MQIIIQIIYTLQLQTFCCCCCCCCMYMLHYCYDSYASCHQSNAQACLNCLNIYFTTHRALCYDGKK